MSGEYIAIPQVTAFSSRERLYRIPICDFQSVGAWLRLPPRVSTHFIIQRPDHSESSAGTDLWHNVSNWNTPVGGRIRSHITVILSRTLLSSCQGHTGNRVYHTFWISLGFLVLRRTLTMLATDLWGSTELLSLGCGLVLGLRPGHAYHHSESIVHCITFR